MALKLFSDAAGTQEITSGNPDTVSKAVTAGSTLTDEKKLYLKSDNATLTYKNITLDGLNHNDNATSSGQVDVLYALDSGGTAGTYYQTLTIPDGAYTASTPIWRKIIAPNVTAAFKRTDIQHQITADEYVA
jgi:hypothetical protein